MLFLLLRILFTTAFSHLLRLSQARTRRPLYAAAVNYAVAAVASGAWTLIAGCRWHTPTILLGIAAGLGYVVSLLLVLPSMRKSGVSVTGAVLQLALMVPVAVGIWRFSEHPNVYQIAGIALTLVSLPILSFTTSVDDPSATRRFSLLTLVLFLSSGLSQVLMKEFSVAALPSDLPLFSTCLFVAATFGTIGWRAFVPEPPPNSGEPEGRLYGEWPLGLALGVVNMLQLVCLLLALQQLPGVVVFPVSASLGIVVNTFASMLFWKERPPLAGWLGIALAILAVILLNLK